MTYEYYEDCSQWKIFFVSSVPATYVDSRPPTGRLTPIEQVLET